VDETEAKSHCFCSPHLSYRFSKARPLTPISFEYHLFIYHNKIHGIDPMTHQVLKVLTHSSSLSHRFQNLLLLVLYHSTNVIEYFQPFSFSERTYVKVQSCCDSCIDKNVMESKRALHHACEFSAFMKLVSDPERGPLSSQSTKLSQQKFETCRCRNPVKVDGRNRD